ncbi:unnamed protein product [Symbiodinium natans]|uniref:Pentatricopeptide repeat-containing protein, chloroplastic n=1 Tax=Symbiodinium natans TaxID=878477 RepID=A0A812KHS5_9DINO|nr:unnamed protein product [Symbiodinium natans]
MRLRSATPLAAHAERGLRDCIQRLCRLRGSGQWQEALWQLHEMQHSGPSPNVIACNVVLSSLEAGQAQALVQELPRMRLQADAVTYGSLIAAHGRARQWAETLAAVEVMRDEGVQLDLVTSSTAISACARSSKWRQALALMRALEGERLQPDVVFYSACIDACAQGRRWTMAVQLLDRMLAQSSPAAAGNVIAYAAALRSLEAHWSVAVQLLVDMKWKRISPDVVAFNAVLGACGSAAQWEAGLQVLAAMAGSRVAQDHVSKALAMSACAQAKRWETALALCPEPEHAITCSAFITACGQGRRWQLALLALSESEVARRSTVCWNATLSACDYWPRSLLLLQHMARRLLRTDLTGQNALLSTLEKGSQWALALDVFWTLRQHHLQPDAISFNSVISACEKGHTRNPRP